MVWSGCSCVCNGNMLTATDCTLNRQIRRCEWQDEKMKQSSPHFVVGFFSKKIWKWNVVYRSKETEFNPLLKLFVDGKKKCEKDFWTDLLFCKLMEFAETRPPAALLIIVCTKFQYIHFLLIGADSISYWRWASSSAPDANTPLP